MRILLLLVSIGLMSCTATAQVKTLDNVNKKAKNSFWAAQDALGYGDVEGALQSLDNAIKEEESFIDAWYAKGSVALDYKRDYELAIESFEKVKELDPNYKTGTFLLLGESYFNNQQYEPARENLNFFLGTSGNKPKFIKQAEVLLASCDFAEEAVKNPVPYEPQNLGPNVNVNYSQYFPALTADEEYLYFTLQDGQQEDIYASRNVKGEWQPLQKINGQTINTPYFNEGAHTISPSGQYLIFTGCNRPDCIGSCDIFISKLEGGVWTDAHNLGKPVNSGNFESQPSISADGRSIYFVSNREGGYGATDIYVTTIGDDGRFGEPVNLGNKVNTFGSEERPFIHPDGQTLYFTSTGHPGMGDMDMFVVRRGPDGEWGEPENLGYPINTNKYDSGLFVSSDGKTAYLASDREHEKDWISDIFSFELPEPARPLMVTYVKGTVFDKANNKKLGANIQLIDLASGETISTMASDATDGSFLMTIPVGKNYAYNVTKEGYIFYSANFSLKDHNPEEPYKLEVGLDKIKEGGIFVLQNIFFESGKYELLPESKVELDKMVEMLENNPSIKVEVGGHTDDVGSEEDNQALSENRSKSVMNYLIENGISADRLTNKGYGESMPIASNDTEEGRAMNRRTEFKITGK